LQTTVHRGLLDLDLFTDRRLPTVVRSGANIVLTGYVGPKAFQSLSAAGIKIGQNLENMTVRQAVEQYKSGDIVIATQPNSRGHAS